MSYRNNVIFFIFVFLASVWFSVPSLLHTDKEPKINLGLDLKGGLYVLLEMDEKNIKSNYLNNIATQINYFSEKNELYIEKLKINENNIHISFLDFTSENKNNINKFFHENKIDFKLINENIKEEIGEYNLFLSQKKLNKLLKIKMDKTLIVIRNRLNQFGLSEPSVVQNGQKRIVVEVAGVDNIDKENRILKLITTTAYLQFMKVSNIKNNNTKKYFDIKHKNIFYNLDKVAILDGSYLEDARIGFDKSNHAEIDFQLNNAGGHIFKNFTSKNKGKRLAIVIDKKVYSTPTINGVIGKNGSISGNFSVEEAKDLVIALKSGSSGVKLNILEKKTIGSSLGKDSIKRGILSLIIGFVLVLIFIIYFYKISGIIASFALIVNLFIIIAIMAFLHATMTLPGIIGIVLTIGMAIDSNIIINERINEYLQQGLKSKDAIIKGYDRAFVTIFDSNITTLLAALILYINGNSTIKGFAITLAIGIIASMFTSIYGTKNLFLYFNPKLKARGVK